MAKKFAGDKKKGASLLHSAEGKLRDYLLPKIPLWCETYHLTWMTLLWSLLIVGFGFLAKYNINWLWFVSFFIFMQYITDLLDGAVGRYRNTGLIKWGYYMDHFLDYIFLCSILIAYSFILPDKFKYILFFLLALFGAFMVNSFLSFAATNEFKIEYMKIGPTEVRIFFIAINTMIIIFGKTYMAWSLPYVLGLSLLGLCVVVYSTQKYIWGLDMDIKKKSKK